MYATIEEARQAALNEERSYSKCIIIFEQNGLFGYTLWNEIKYVWTIIPIGSKPVETSRYNPSYDNEGREFQPYTLSRSGEMRATGFAGPLTDAIEDIENGADAKNRLKKLLDDMQ